MLEKSGFKTYLLLAVFVAAFLALVFGNLISSSVESTEQESLASPAAPVSGASPRGQSSEPTIKSTTRETAFSVLPTLSTVVLIQPPTLGRQTASDDAGTMSPSTAADPIGPLLPSQSITLPLTAYVYVPAIFSHHAIPPVYTYTVVHTYPHDLNAFTQGLVLENGVLYEGTGLYGRSSLRKVELETGSVLQIYRLPEQFFGEGITIYGEQIIQLTWKSHVGFVYVKDSFRLLKTFNYPTEGWGITHDGERLIMSDGTSTLYFLDPETLEEIGQIEVHDNNGPVVRLNELEYIQGEVYANVWQTDRIARVDPQTGQVLGWINLKGLSSHTDLGQPVDVLNGIAYDAEGDRLFVTGKLWPTLFEIELLLPSTLSIPGD